MLESRSRTYKNEHITVYWKPELCCHSTICIRKLPRVFNLNRSPWVDLNAEPVEKIVEVVKLCPQGALTFEYNY